MPLFRSGLLLATLFLSACSMPIFQESQSTTTEKSISNDTIAEQKTQAEDTVAVISNDQLLEQLDAQKKLATNNFSELKNRVGSAPDMPKSWVAKESDSKDIRSDIQQFRTYVSKTNTELAVLNARVDDRQKLAVKGDLIQIFLSDATITHNDVTFKAQPLVGQWVRGESRVIRLKDNILFENPKSEDLHITFSETYQLVVNNRIIATVNPHKEKNSASFNVTTFDDAGSIVGKLDYRVIGSK